MTSGTVQTVNIRAEKLLLGGLMRSETAFWQVADVIRPDHFSNSIHRQIYSVVRDICMEGKRISLTLLSARLPEEDDAGKSMAAYLAVLLAGAEDSGSPIDYVEPIISAWARRKILEAATQLQEDVRSPKKAVADIISDASSKLLDVSHGAEPETEKPLSAVLDVAVRSAADAYQDETKVPGIDTGLPSLDEISGRMMPGDLIFLGGSQGDGKTAVATQIACHVAKKDTVLFFEGEMAAVDVGRRLLASESRMSVSMIEEGDFNSFEYERLVDAQRNLQGLKIIFDDRPKLRFGQVRARALAIHRSRGLGLMVIDHLRLIQADIKVKDIFERTEYVTGALKALAKELKVPILCLAQRTRGAQDRDDPTPRITDFWGGGSIEQDADGVIGVWRRDLWLKQRRPRESEEKRYGDWVKDLENCRDVIEAICLKRRRGAAMEKRRFRWNGEATKLEEIVK